MALNRWCMCTDDNAEVTGRWARSRAVRGGNSGGEGVCARHGGAPASALRTTRRDATRQGRRKRARRGVPVTFQVGQGRWHEKGEMGREKRRKRVGARRVEGGGTGEERSRIIASHSRRILHLLLLHGEGVGVHASRRNRCPASDWRLARDRPSPIGG